MRPAGLLLACTLLAACAHGQRVVPVGPEQAPAPVRTAASVPTSRVTAANELVAYLARLRSLDERALAAETARQKQAARAAPSDLARLKLALALSLAPDAPEGDILALVDPVARRDAADDDLQAVAGFLQVHAQERRRLRESAATAAARLRDERRATEVQKQRADALQERAEQLQQKLDALTELEKSLSERQPQAR